MRAGSLTRYHIPYLRGKDFSQELVKLAGPTLIRSIGHGLQAYEKGASLEDDLSASGQVLKKGLKQKLPTAVSTLAKSAVNEAIKRKENGSKTYWVRNHHETWT